MARGNTAKIAFQKPEIPLPDIVASSYLKSLPYLKFNKALLLLTIFVFIPAIING